MPTQELRNTLSSFIERMRRYLKQEDATKSQWTDAFLRQVFNVWWRLRAVEAVQAHEGFFTIIGTRDIEANIGRYAWPSSFSRLLRMEIVRTDGRRVPLERWERRMTVLQPANLGGDSYVPTYRPVGSGFVLEPTPAESVTAGLHLEWNGTPDEITDDGDGLPPDWPQEFTELIILDAVVAAFDQEGMQESGQRLSLAGQRVEISERYVQYINSRMISRPGVEPFSGHYADA